MNIQRETDGRVAILRLNRPAARNAMSAGLVAELQQALDGLDGDESIGAVLILGNGAGFCAGSDLVGLSVMTPAGRKAFEAASGRAARAIGQIAKPVIASVAGFAIGGGFTLATACDVVFTDAKAVWQLPEIPIGVFPAWGLEPVIARAGRAAARRLCWGIDAINGAEARRLGLADEAVDGDPFDAALAHARRIAALPHAQAKAVKDFFAASAGLGGEDSDLAANEIFIRLGETELAQATFRKFAAKAKG